MSKKLPSLQVTTYKNEDIKIWKTLPKMDLVIKSDPVEDDEGLLTKTGMRVAHLYAKMWVDSSSRDLELERSYPDLAGLFYDIRQDRELASMHAIP